MYFWHVFKWSAHFYYNRSPCCFGWFQFTSFTFNWVQTFDHKTKITKNSTSEAQGCITRISVYNRALSFACLWLVLEDYGHPGWLSKGRWVIKFIMYQLIMLRKKLCNDKSKMSDRPKSWPFPRILAPPVESLPFPLGSTPTMLQPLL